LPDFYLINLIYINTSYSVIKRLQQQTEAD